MVADWGEGADLLSGCNTTGQCCHARRRQPPSPHLSRRKHDDGTVEWPVDRHKLTRHLFCDTSDVVVVSNNLLVTLVTQKIVVDRPL